VVQRSQTRNPAALVWTICSAFLFSPPFFLSSSQSFLRSFRTPPPRLPMCVAIFGSVGSGDNLASSLSSFPPFPGPPYTSTRASLLRFPPKIIPKELSVLCPPSPFLAASFFLFAVSPPSMSSFPAKPLILIVAPGLILKLPPNH